MHLILLAAFLALVASGPTFSGHRDQLAAAASSGCTQTDSNGAIVNNNCQHVDRAVNETTGSNANPTVTNQGECTNENIQRWSASPDPSLQQKATDCKARIGTITYKKPDGTTGTICATCSGGGIVSQGPNGPTINPQTGGLAPAEAGPLPTTALDPGTQALFDATFGQEAQGSAGTSAGTSGADFGGLLGGSDAGSANGSGGGYLGVGQGLNGNLSSQESSLSPWNSAPSYTNNSAFNSAIPAFTSSGVSGFDVPGTTLGDSSPAPTWDYSSPLGGESAMNGPGAVGPADLFLNESPAFARYAATGSAFPISVVDPGGNTIATLHGEDYGLTGTGEITVDAAHLNGNPIGMGSQAERITNTLLTGPEQAIFSQTNGDGHTLAQDIGSAIDTNESQKAWYTQAWESLNGGSDRLTVQGDVAGQNGVTNYLYSPDQMIIGMSADEYAAQQAARDANQGLPGASTGITAGSDITNPIQGLPYTQSGPASILNQQNPLYEGLAQQGQIGTQSGLTQTPQTSAIEVSTISEQEFRQMYPEASQPALEANLVTPSEFAAQYQGPLPNSNPDTNQFAPYADTSVPGTTQVADHTDIPGSTPYSLPPASQSTMNQQNPLIAEMQTQGQKGSQSGAAPAAPTPVAESPRTSPTPSANSSQPASTEKVAQQPAPRSSSDQPSRSGASAQPSPDSSAGSGSQSPAINPIALMRAIPVSQLLGGAPSPSSPSASPQPTLNVLATNQPSPLTVPLYTQPTLSSNETGQTPQGGESPTPSQTPAASPANSQPQSAQGGAQTAPQPNIKTADNSAPASNAKPGAQTTPQGIASRGSPSQGNANGGGGSGNQSSGSGGSAPGSAQNTPVESKTPSAAPAHQEQQASSTPSGSASQGSTSPQPEQAAEQPPLAEVTPAKTNLDKTVDTVKTIASLPLQILSAVFGSTPAEAREAFLDRNPSDQECLTSPQCLITRTGLSTWYDPAEGGINGGGTTANGEQYDRSAKTFASVSLPLNTVAQVCSGNHCQYARVNDTGSFGRAPYSRPGAPRISDLTRIFAQEMGISGANPIRITPVAIVANKGIAGAQAAQVIVQSLNGGAPLADATRNLAPQLRWVADGLPASAGAVQVSAPSFKTFSSAIDPNAKPAAPQQKASEPAKKPAHDYLAPLEQPTAQVMNAKDMAERAAKQSDPQLGLRAAMLAKPAVDAIAQTARAEAADQQTSPADAEALNGAATAAQSAASDMQSKLVDFNKLPQLWGAKSQFSEQGNLKNALAADRTKLEGALATIGGIAQKTSANGNAAPLPFTPDGITGARVQASGAQGALQKFADAQKYAFGRTNPDGSTQMLNPQEAGKLSPEERNKLDVYQQSADGFHKVGTVPQYLAQQKAAAEAAIKNGYYDAQLNGDLRTQALRAGGTLQTAGAGTVRPVYATAADGTRKQVGIVHTISDSNARILAAAQKQGVHVHEKNGALYDDQNRRLELRGEGSKLVQSAPKQQVPTTFGGKVAKAAGVPLQKMSHEDWVAALQNAGVKVQDLSSRLPVASNLAWQTDGTRVMIHGDVSSGDNLVKYEMGQLSSGKVAAQAVLKEDGTFVVLKRLDTGAFQAGSSNRQGFGFETAGADNGREATDPQFDVQKKIADIALSHGIEVGTHGMAEPGHRMSSEGGTRIVSYVYGNGPVMAPQVGLYGVDASGAGQKIGDTMNSSDIAGAQGVTTFESTDPNGKPDGTMKFALKEADVGTVTPALAVDGNGNLGVEYQYTPPPQPETPPVPAPPSPMQRAMDAMRNLFDRMFNPQQMQQLQQGGGGSGGGGSSGGRGNIPPPIPPSPQGQAILTCSPYSVETKATSTPIAISWNCPAGSDAQSFGFSAGGKNAGTITFSTTTAAQSLSFALLCSTKTQAPQNVTCTTRILHPAAALIANPDSLNAGGSAALMWSSVDTAGCKLYGPPSTLLASGGSSGQVQTGSLAQPSVFRLACDSSGVSIQASTTVRIAGDSSAPLGTSIGDTITQ